MTDKQPKKTSGFKKFLRWLLVICLLVAAFTFWWKYYYLFGEGSKAGQLNNVVKKRNLLKPYKDKLIQAGFRTKTAGNIQSYEFEFSVTDDSLANVLMNNSGSHLDLHYKEYKSALPWRGYSPFIVDKIISIEPEAK